MRKVCPERGYLLEVVTCCSATWSNFIIGDPISNERVVGGSWADGTPLFIAATLYLHWKIGYYLPSSKTAFIMNHDDNNPACKGLIRVCTAATFYVILPHWHDTSSWNPFAYKTGTYLFSILWALMSWWRKEPGHHQPWYLLCWTGLIRSPNVKG